MFLEINPNASDDKGWGKAQQQCFLAEKLKYWIKEELLNMTLAKEKTPPETGVPLLQHDVTVLAENVDTVKVLHSLFNDVQSHTIYPKQNDAMLMTLQNW